MPTFTVSGYECAHDLLPPVCAQCGRPATERVRLTFSYQSGWTAWIILAGWLARKRMTVNLPFCSTHARRWRWRTVVHALAFLPAGVACALFIWRSVIHPRPVPAWVPGMVTLAVLITLTSLLAGAASLFPFSVRMVRITDRHLTLDGVHADFIAELIEDRAAGTDPLRAAGYGDVRDDFAEPPDRGD
jgi:hypothetical protein